MAQKYTLAKMETETNHPYSTQFDDIYFSPTDGVAETTHVFMNGNDLPARFSALSPNQIFTIGETGFGTGLNFLIAAKLFLETAPDTSQLYFYSFEKFPLSVQDIKKYLLPWRYLFPQLFDNFLDQYPLRVGGWHSIRIHDRITAVVAFDDIARALPYLPAPIDAWFLDGFAPSKNPDMWSQNIFDFMARHSHETTTLSSFTAAGNVRRGLNQSGFHIEKTNGFGHKRDMIIGKFSQNVPRIPLYISPPQKIAIIGAGLAGAQLAHHLNHDHHDITVFDKNGIASGASGNPIGLYNPRLSAERNAISDFYSSSFSAVYHFLKAVHDDIDFNPCGAVHLINDSTKQKRYTNCLTSWDWHHDHAEMIDASQTIDISGTNINQSCLWLKDSGYVSPYKLCNTLLKNHRITHEAVDVIQKNHDQWIVNDKIFDHVIIANGAHKITIENFEPLPIQSVRGQIAIVESKKNLDIKTALCFGGYLSPASPSTPQTYILGSSFQPWLDDPHIRTQDNHDMIVKLYETIPSLIDQFIVRDARVGFRAASPDRTPMIGAYPHAPNLWISSAHGSHGLLSSLTAARIISNQIAGRPAETGQHIIDVVAPIRFEKRLKNDKTKS
jgi:tRNA 5-methylaminomethyl-2-thiouridine biosynthesis bifunctional protein